MVSRGRPRGRLSTRPRRRGPLTGMWGVPGRPRVWRTEELRAALVEAGGNQAAAARALGCDEETFRRRRAQEPELDRAVTLLKSLTAKRTYASRVRERARKRAAHDALGLRPGMSAAAPLQAAPRVVVVYEEAAGDLVRRSPADGEAAEVDDAPHRTDHVVSTEALTEASPRGRGRWLPAPVWAPAGWVRVEVLAPTTFKHYGELRVHDVVALPPSVAHGWLAAGMARPVPRGESGAGADRR